MPNPRRKEWRGRSGAGAEGPTLLRTCLWTTFFIDILGWSRLLLELNNIHSFIEDKQRVRETATKPILQRELVRTVVERTQKRTGRVPPRVAQMSPEARAVFEKSVAPEMTLRDFGDSFVITVPWIADGKLASAVATNSVSILFHQAASIMIYVLAAQVPLRGAIEGGYGTEYRPRGLQSVELASASIASAYEIESRVAKYVRIGIGPGIFGKLQGHADRIGDSVARMTSGGARQALRLCRREEDGTISLDYLSPEIIGPQGIMDTECTLMAYTFVDESLAAAQKRHNLELIAKYERTRQYFEEKCGPLRRRVYAPKPRS